MFFLANKMDMSGSHFRVVVLSALIFRARKLVFGKSSEIFLTYDRAQLK